MGLTNTNGKFRSVTTRVTDNTVDNLPGGVVTHNPGTGVQTNFTVEESTTALPLILGFEGDVTSNWTLRAAVKKDLFLSQVEETTMEVWATPDNNTGPGPVVQPTIQTYTTKNEFTRGWNTDTVISLGAGYKNGSLAVDAVVLKEFVTQGVDNGSGRPPERHLEHLSGDYFLTHACLGG